MLAIPVFASAKSAGPNVSSGVRADVLGRVVEFQLYSGNESLPPAYQRILTIRGKINQDYVTINYSF